MIEVAKDILERLVADLESTGDLDAALILDAAIWHLYISDGDETYLFPGPSTVDKYFHV